jgi:hypothetical protein
MIRKSENRPPQDHAATPGVADDYCSRKSSKNDFFSPGGATGLPNASKPFF